MSRIVRCLKNIAGRQVRVEGLIQMPASKETKSSTLKPKITKHKQKWYRTAVQVFFFVFVGYIAIASQLKESGTSLLPGSSASLHAICPFGGVVSIYKFLTVGTFVQKIHESSFILMAVGFLLAIVFGPVICGWVCPLGSFQEWLGKIGKKIFGKRYNHFIPAKADSVLRYSRYIVLALVIYATATSAKLVFQDYDPYYALFHFWSAEVAPAALIILAVTILLSLVIERPWCKYACPYGAVLGVFNLFRIFKIRRDDNTCINCKACDRNCPMNITVSDDVAVLNHQCISCLKCTSENYCPVEDTVNMSIKTGAKQRRIKSVALAILIPVVIFGSVALTSALGLWKTTNDKVPAVFTSGEFTGQYNPADIRGSYTFDDIFNAFEIPLADLGQAFGVEDPADYAGFQVKELESIYADLAANGREIGTNSVRYFVALYKGLPFDAPENIYLPKPAVEILKAKAPLTDAQKQALDAIAVDLTAKTTPGASQMPDETTPTDTDGASGAGSGSPDETPTGTPTEESANTIKGSTTFGELLSWGVSQEAIEQVIQDTMPAQDTLIKDYATSKDIAFSDLKEALQDLVE